MHLLDTVKKHLIKIKERLFNEYHSDKPSNELSTWINKPDESTLSKWWKPGIPSIDDVTHGAINPKSTTLKWFGMDNEIHFDSIKETHNDWGFTKDNVNYTFNSLGYRNDEPEGERDFTVLISGDSHTFGIALDNEQIWPSQFKIFLQQQYPKCKVINISCPGGSNDWISRSLSCAIQTVKPDLVIAVYTYPNRREAIWDSGFLWQLNTTVPDNPRQNEYEEFQSWFMTINEHTDYYNMMKNHWLVKLACNNKTTLIPSQVTQMQLIQKQLGTILQYNDVARDCKHFGPRVHREFAKQIYNKFCRLQNIKKNV